MPGLTSMRNIGREMARKLLTVGINSPEQLTAIGAKQAFFQLKAVYPQVCLVHLYALEGAVEGIEFNRLSEEKKKDSKDFSDFWDGSDQ